MYKNNILLVSISNEDIDIFLNRPMFRNIDNYLLYNLYIEDIDYISDNDMDYVLTLINKEFYITNIEYRLLDILYNNTNIHDNHTLYQFIYTHPLLQIQDIDEYIKYRNRLDTLCEFDIDYNNIISRTIY
jgi:hypothetical protein